MIYEGVALLLVRVLSHRNKYTYLHHISITSILISPSLLLQGLKVGLYRMCVQGNLISLAFVQIFSTKFDRFPVGSVRNVIFRETNVTFNKCVGVLRFHSVQKKYSLKYIQSMVPALAQPELHVH